MAAALIVTKKKQGALNVEEYTTTLPVEGIVKEGVLGRQATSVSGNTFPSRKVTPSVGVNTMHLACELSVCLMNSVVQVVLTGDAIYFGKLDNDKLIDHVPISEV